MKKKRKLSFQKIFNFLSFIFLITCVFWYGGRTIYLYLQNEKENVSDVITISKTILTKHKNELKSVNKDNYFYGKSKNNYLTYSNLTWRILKIDEKGNLTLILDSPITTLAYGEVSKLEESYIYNWLNKTSDDNTGILETKLNNSSKYIIPTNTCIDTIDNIENTTCKNTLDIKISLPSLTDYINSGATDSFINNGYYTYLSNTADNDEIWYITDNGKLSTSDGTDIYGIKPVITIPSNITSINGNGTEDNPYTIEDETSFFASFIKLDKDIWRVYEYDDTTLKLVLNNKLEEKNIYSNNNYFHNDTQSNSLAYYLNNTYLNSLSYKDSINTSYFTNYYYGYTNNYDYKEIINKTVDTKVIIPSIGDVILNNIDEYFTNTGTAKNDNKVYVINKNGTVKTISTSTESNIIPCISINKDILTKGKGTKDEPYEME